MYVIIVQLLENTAVHQLNWHRSEIYSLLLLPVIHNMDIRHIMSLNDSLGSKADIRNPLRYLRLPSLSLKSE